MEWHLKSAEETLQELKSFTEGLSVDEVQRRLQEYGPNELAAKKKMPAIIFFLRQFKDIMILVLIAAAVISAFIGEITDTIVIVVIILLNAVIGFVQEYRAEKAMDALKKMAAPNAVVLRNNATTTIAAAALVPGDIILLEAGNTVPADIRLLELHALKINEASLTGESDAADKTTDALQLADAAPGDRINMAFRGTEVTNGNARGVVVTTGMKTELGKVAGMLDNAESETPLQKRLKDVSKKLTFIILGLCALFFFTGYLRGDDIANILLTSISLAVAAIPEALPAVITVSLALGARKLARKNVLIRKLQAVETLGSVTYICTDKTGTLTKNEMMVKEVWSEDAKKGVLLHAMSLNNDVKKQDGKFAGDPTEIAMVIYADDQPHLNRVEEIPFDSERKAMTTVHENNGQFWVITKGASESVVAMLVDDADRELIEKETARMSAMGMRVIAFAGKQLPGLTKDIQPAEAETGLDFIGLAGLIDPPRDEASESIRLCKQAGIVPVMITGDHPLTAASIAKEIGIIDSEEHKVMTGKELAAIDEGDFENEVEKIRVYARVSPEQKLRIVDTLQKKGHFVSMTGDGVNDAPSLKKANIGVAMGITGTDVSKEASHMILLDDNFASIIGAVKEGRRIYDNLRKFVKYIFTGNTAEIVTLFVAPLMGLPMPLLPVHILWVNLITDGLPALALSTEPAEKNIMRRLPRHPNESIFAKGLGIHIIWVGLFVGALTLATQFYLIDQQVSHWQTLVFTVLCFAQLWHVMAIKSETASVFSTGVFDNKPLLLAVTGTIGLQLAVIYVPALNSYFHTEPLTAIELVLAFAISSVVLLVVELEKTVKRRKLKK
ncbi:MAG: cation-translocating P-type ATPase [Rhizobacter sp.]|nr:cation-translocating P-type ATPase [Ferruginibacter sp.]